ESEDDRVGVAVVETRAVALEDLHVADERAQLVRARLADGKGETHGGSEADSIEAAGADVEHLAVDPGLGAVEHLSRMRPLPPHRVRFPRQLDAQARARGPGGAHARGCKPRLGREPEEGEAGCEVDVAALEARKPLERGGAAELEALRLWPAQGNRSTRLELHIEVDGPRCQRERERDKEEESEPS